jgi:hypothetical protein
MIKFFSCFKTGFLFLVTASGLIACFYNIPEKHISHKFDSIKANDFATIINTIPEITSISIVDEIHDGNNFKVNDQKIFLDTNQTDFPNYYNYRKRARELKINDTLLANGLKAFYEMHVWEYKREENFLRFRNTVGFTVEKGFVYSPSKLKTGDTLTAKSKSGEYAYKIILTKPVAELWFEYAEFN